MQEQRRRIDQLQILRDLKSRHEQVLAKQMAVAQQAWQQQQDTLDQLNHYQQDYMAGARTHLQPWALNNMQVFLVQLDKVIATQMQQVQEALTAYQYLQTQWQQAHNHLQRFVEFVQQQERQYQQQRIQMMDTAAQELFGLYQLNKKDDG